jgi:hypothetical protein
LDKNRQEQEKPVSRRIDSSWTVFVSVENPEADKCVDFFSRADRSYGFEEFRRDVEDGGRWTPVQCYSDAIYVSPNDALNAAERCVSWLLNVLACKPELRKRIISG